MKTNPSTHSSERQLPAVHGALLELHVLAIRLLVKAGLRPSDVAQVRRSTLRAILAVGMASAGHRRRYHVRRAHESITSCLDLFSVFYLEDRIEAPVYGELRRRVDQVLDALDQLSTATEAQWLTLSLPPADPVDGDQLSSPMCTGFEELLARVDAIVGSVAPPPPLEQSGPGDAVATT